MPPSDFAFELGPHAGDGTRAGHRSIHTGAEPPDSVHIPAGGEGGRVPPVLEGRRPLPED